MEGDVKKLMIESTKQHTKCQYCIALLRRKMKLYERSPIMCAELEGGHFEYLLQIRQ
jgi:hypothetical protein